MKTFVAILFYFVAGQSFGQQLLNLRYNLDHEAAAFGSVIATDSCYYVSGVQLNQNGSFNYKGTLAKVNFSGTIDSVYTLDIDSLGLTFEEHPNLIKSLDGNFSIIARARNADGASIPMFIKLSPSMDTICTSLISELYYTDNNTVIEPSTLIQNDDSTYFALIYTQKNTNLAGCAVLVKLAKNGQVTWKQFFCGYTHSPYRILMGGSLLKLNENLLVIGTTMLYVEGSVEDTRYIPKLFFVDSLGSILQEEVYWDDSLSAEIRGLRATSDGGMLWCGQKAEFDFDLNGHFYKRTITKLKPDYSKEWEIVEGTPSSFYYNDNNMIHALNDSEFVAVGNHGDSINLTGNLTKFDIDGDIIWSRGYYKVPHFWGESNNAQHVFRDVDVTMDSGFVMVGYAQNNYNNGYPEGHHAWIVKVDKYGCLVPDCHLYDNVDTTETSDSTIVIDPPIESSPKPDVLYPNPANEEMFYYHHQKDFIGEAKGFVFDASGKRIYYWSVNQNDITYIIPTNNLEAGVYFLKVIEGDKTVRNEKFVVVH